MGNPNMNNHENTDGQSKYEQSRETQCIQDKDEQNNSTTEHNYTETNTNNVNKT